ncbi:MAG TPA: hypothetical protein VKP30_22730 [Polyangiaceae bacterium]|nr:hypothetical protein [Polyangiaceae bacterium]
MSTNACMFTSSHVCLCEWSGPVTVTMVVALLSQLKQAEEGCGAASVLILTVGPSSAKSIVHRSSTFVDVLPALWAYCQEIVIACQDEHGMLDQLRRCLCGSSSTLIATLARPLTFFELVDSAFTYVEGVYPHDMLELKRRRLRSGSWPIYETEERKTARTSTREG